MASRLFSRSIRADNTKLAMNSQQQSNLVLPSPAVPSQQHRRLKAPVNQITESGPSHPNAEVVVEIPPNVLLDGNRYSCHLCYKGFQREQNLTLHKRVHNLPFQLKSKATTDEAAQKKVYLCPEPTCINHNRSHALGDFGGLKKHYLRKHSTDKKHKCKICSKSYAVASDLRAHLKTCDTKKYNCECGSRFSSYNKFSNHQDYCDALVLEDAAKDAPNSEMSNLLRSMSNNKINSSINSTTPYLPPSKMGDNSSRSITNINNNGLFGSTSSYIPFSAMGSNNNTINNLTADSPMSQLPMFNMGHGSVQSVNNNNSHIGFTTQNQHEFQGNTGTGYFTNLMMGYEYNNVNPVNTIYMGGGSQYGNVEGSNLFSGSSMMFNNSSSTTSITPNMVHGFTGSSSNGISMSEEQYVPFGTPNVVGNQDLYGSNMVHPYAMFSSSGGGSIWPQEHNFPTYGNEQFSIADNSGFNDLLNSLNNPVTGSGVESSMMNEDVGGGDYQGNYSGYADGAGMEVLNSGIGEVAMAPNEDQYCWNENGYWV